jgi:transposase
MIYVGMDIHKEFSRVAGLDERGEMVLDGRVNHRHREELEEFFGLLPAGSEVTMEATCGWGWLSELAQRYGLEVKLAHPGKVRIIAESQIKTDRVDALALAQLLRTGFLPEAYLAPFPVREARDRLRFRQSLVTLRSSVKHRVCALLVRLGIYHPFSDLFGKAGMAFLRQLEVGSVHRQTLDGYLSTLEHLNGLIRQTEKQIRHLGKTDELTRRLKTLPGIGDILSYLLKVEIGEISRFASDAKLAAYAGLVPSVHQSGSRLYRGHLTKAGNRYLRWGMIEAAQAAMRTDPFWKSWAARLIRKKGRGVATAAVAHKLLIAVYHIWKDGTEYKQPKFSLGKPVAPMGVPSQAD